MNILEAVKIHKSYGNKLNKQEVLKGLDISIRSKSIKLILSYLLKKAATSREDFVSSLYFTEFHLRDLDYLLFQVLRCSHLVRL
jgi:hypothetical protein